MENRDTENGNNAERKTETKTETIDLELIRREFVDSSAKSMILSAIFQILLGGIIGLFAYLPILITMDVLYWPPFMIFTIENTLKWLILAAIILIYSLIQIIIALVYRSKYRNLKVQKIAKIISILQLFFIPIGTLFAVMELTQMKWTKSDDYLLHVLKENDEQSIKKEIGNTTILAAIIHIAALNVLYLLTIYLSTVMLDMTYPYLTMSVLYQIRIFIGIAIIIFIGQMVVGFLYRKSYHETWVKVLAYFFGIIQLFMIPIGTYAGVLLIKDLRYDAKDKGKRRERHE